MITVGIDRQSYPFISIHNDEAITKNKFIFIMIKFSTHLFSPKLTKLNGNFDSRWSQEYFGCLWSSARMWIQGGYGRNLARPRASRESPAATPAQRRKSKCGKKKKSVVKIEM